MSFSGKKCIFSLEATTFLFLVSHFLFNLLQRAYWGSLTPTVYQKKKKLFKINMVSPLFFQIAQA